MYGVLFGERVCVHVQVFWQENIAVGLLLIHPLVYDIGLFLHTCRVVLVNL